MVGSTNSPGRQGRSNGVGYLRRTNTNTTDSDLASTVPSSPSSEGQPESPQTITIGRPITSPTVDAESYFNSLQSMRSSSRTNSVYSLSRISLSSQLSQLTSLSLPEASSLSTSISAIPTALAAVKTLRNAAEQIRKWLQKASEVLRGLDAEDDVEWAAAGGREGLGELDAAIGKFEGLIEVYVTAIEDLQVREDNSRVPEDQQRAIVDQMEQILTEWNDVKNSLKAIKRQVELAMEWEELWNTVLGDIGMELEALSVQVFEMEEARHKSMAVDTHLEGNGGLDVQELDTIIEENPSGETKRNKNRFSLPPTFKGMSPLTSPGLSVPQDDTKLLALFARMQPLRASLDFLPMTLASFHMKAKDVLPSACEELQTKRSSLEKKWKQLEGEAEGLRQELGEDRWVLVFRNAARQAQKMCESVERSIAKLQESIDAGTHHSNPPLLAKKLEAYEAKRSHYGPAIKKVLEIIEKGVSDRQTVHGEVLRLREEARGRWSAIETEMRGMDLALEDLSMHKNQQLRDSISSIVSMDRSVNGSTVDTPGSSPASSVAMGPANMSKREPSPGMNGANRRSSLGRRYFSLPSVPASTTHLPLSKPTPRHLSSTSTSRNASPSPYAKASPTPTPGSQSSIAALPLNNKPRWNASSKVDHYEFGSKPRSLPFSHNGRKSSANLRAGSSAASHHASASATSLSSPLGRSSPAPSTATNLAHRSRLASGTSSSLGLRRSSAAPVSAKHQAFQTPPGSSNGPNHQRSSFLSETSLQSSPPTESMDGDSIQTQSEDISPSVRRHPLPLHHHHQSSPNIAHSTNGGNRRISMLPVPRKEPLPLPSYSPTTAVNSGRESAWGSRSASRATSRTHVPWK